MLGAVFEDLFEPLVLEPDLIEALLFLVEVQAEARAVLCLAPTTDEETLGSPLELAGLPSGVVGDLSVDSSLPLRWLGFDHHLLV